MILPARPQIEQAYLLRELQISRQTLLNWRKNGMPGPISKDGRSCIYDTAAVFDWINAHTGRIVRIL